jgi:hypothetical protein
VGLKRFKIIHGLGFCLFFAQLSGAFEVAAMQQPKFYLCVHTKQRIEKGKPCPCGCDKRLKTLARAKLLNADHPCANEGDDSIVPAFARWIFTNSQVGAPPFQYQAFSMAIFSAIYTSYISDIDTPPPRIV